MIRPGQEFTVILDKTVLLSQAACLGKPGDRMVPPVAVYPLYHGEFGAWHHWFEFIPGVFPDWDWLDHQTDTVEQSRRPALMSMFTT